MGSRLAIEVQCGQMSLYTSDSTSASQTDSLWLFTSQPLQSAKCLGITISDNMDWGHHISEISSKATKSKTLSFLSRNLAFAPRSTKVISYNTSGRHAAPIWSPYSKLQINQVEKIQRTAACWICRRWGNTSSVGEMLEWPSL